MLTPEYILRATEGAEEISQKLRQDILADVIRRLIARVGNGEEVLLSSTDKYQIKVLQEAGYLLEDIQKDIAKYTKIQNNEIKLAFENAAIESLEYDNAIFASAGVEPITLAQSPYIVQMLEDTYRATFGEWKNITRTTAHQAQRLFINECDRAMTNVQSGGMSYTQAIEKAIDNVISNGATIEYKDKNGIVTRRDTIETAVTRAVRTGIVQSTARVQERVLEDLDWDIVLVSAHMGARPTHEVWQGQFYSLGGEFKDEYPDFYKETRYGEVDGLCGINCRHSFGPGDGKNNPYSYIDTEENKKQYEIDQRMRELERRLRKTGYEKRAYKTAYDSFPDSHVEQKEAVKKKLDQKNDLYDKQMREYLDFCKAHDRKPLYDRIRIARQQNYGKRKKAV